MVVASLLTISLLVVIVVLGEQKISGATMNLNQFQAVFDQTTSIERGAAQMQHQAYRFIADRDATAAAAFAEAAPKVAHGLDVLRSMPAAQSVEGEIGDLADGLTKISTFFGEITATAGTLGLDDGSGLRGQLKTSAQAVEDELKLWPNLDKLIVPMVGMRIQEKNFFLYGDAAAVMGPYRKAYNEFTFKVGSVELDDETKQKLTQLAKAYRRDFESSVDAVKSLHQEITVFNDNFRALGPRFGALLETARQGMTEATARQKAVRDQVVAQSLVILVVLLGAFVIISLIVSLSITRPLRAIERAMRRLAGGDEETAIPGVGRRDEIGEMARAVQVFKNGLSERARLAAEQLAAQEARDRRARALESLIDGFQTTIMKVIGTVSAAANDLRANSEIMTGIAEQTRKCSEVAANAANDASTNVQTVAAASEELHLSITEIGRQIQETAQITANAANDAAQTNSNVEGLAAAALKIDQVVKLIEAISAQTNLLALNATIEAAHAGDAGKGFVIVANEVKSLARKTAEATREIAAQISGMQAMTAGTVTAMRSIGTTIASLNQVAAVIASAVEEQTAATNAIARNIEQAAAGTMVVSVNVYDVNTETSTTAETARRVLTAAADLARQGEILRNDVEVFVEQVRAA
jgi:methyl-accepting chemotaxis protein